MNLYPYSIDAMSLKEYPVGAVIRHHNEKMGKSILGRVVTCKPLTSLTNIWLLELNTNMPIVYINPGSNQLIIEPYRLEDKIEK